MRMLFTVHAAQVRAPLDARFDVRNTVSQFDPNGVGTAANLHVCQMMAFLAVFAGFIREAPNQIGHIIAEFASNILDSSTRIFDRVVQPRGRQQHRVVHPELTEIGDHPGQVICVKITATIILARMYAAGKIRCTLLDVVHTHLYESVRCLRLGGPTMIRNLLAASAVAITLIQPARADAQFVSGAVGAVGGIGAGGYVTLAVVVARAQYGHYLHDAEDLLGWNSVPVLLGAATGTAVGVWSADRMVTGYLYGTGGMLIGGSIGYLVGPLIWKRPEGKWAGGAIGAGAGMAAGYFIGVFMPRKGIAPGFLGNSDKAAIPINVTITIP
jgi:hypothetical protein